MRISRRTLLRAGASTGLVAALAACGGGDVRSTEAQKGTPAKGSSPARPGAAPTDAPPRTKFAMVGDSITKASAAPLKSVLEQQGFSQIDIEAEVSRRIAVGDGKREPLSGVKTMFTMLSNGITPDVWAVAMGTNDVGKYPDGDAYGAIIDQMMDMPDADVPMLWVDVYNPLQLAATKMFNAELRDRAAARGNVTVVHWFDLASDPKEKILRDDHIHPNDKGTVVFADLVATALR